MWPWMQGAPSAKRPAFQRLDSLGILSWSQIAAEAGIDEPPRSCRAWLRSGPIKSPLDAARIFAAVAAVPAVVLQLHLRKRPLDRTAPGFLPASTSSLTAVAVKTFQVQARVAEVPGR